MRSSKQRKIEKLDFILAGAQKCGTTALHYFLEQHPQIALPDKQEMHFFDDEELFAKEPAPYDRLHSSFKPGKRTMIAGENTPSYIYWKPAIERIWNYNEAIKLIILLRNPVERAFSHWNMQRDRGYETLDFLDAVRAEPERLREALPLQSKRFSYIDRGFYSEQLERVFRFFPRSQVHLIKFENFRTDQLATMQAVFRFLAVNPLPRLRNKKRNLIPYLREMTSDERRHVAEIFRQEIPRLEKLVGWDCSDWKES
jgi:hypothetical protein